MHYCALTCLKTFQRKYALSNQFPGIFIDSNPNNSQIWQNNLHSAYWRVMVYVSLRATRHNK